MDIDRSCTNRVAAFTTGLDLNGVPRRVVKRAKLCVMDTLGVMLAGLDTRASRIVREVVRLKGGTGAASVFGSEFKAPASEAAFANCFAASILDMDDGHDLGGHPGAPVVPSALAAAEATGASGKELLEAVVVGYEVAIRALDILTAGYSGGPGTEPLLSTGQPYHSTGTGGAYGAAVAAAKLFQLDQGQTTEALGIAASTAPSTRPRQGHPLGPMEKESIGWAGKSGIEAALLAKHGLTGPSTIFDDQRKFTNVDTIGKTYEILSGYFKPYPSCRYTHSAIDVTAALMAKHDLTAQDVSRVKVRCPKQHLALNSVRPTNIVQAQFSFPFVLGAVLAYGRHSIETMTEESLSDEAILEQARKVMMEHDPSMEGKEWSGAVTLETIYGRTYEFSKVIPKGDPKEPMTESELRAKFMELAGISIRDESAERLVNLINDLENVSDIHKLTNILRLAVPKAAAI